MSYTDYYTSAYQYAERFDEKNHLEMQFINSSGRVDVSASGLVAGSTPNTPDINGALRGGTLSSWIGIDQTTGERLWEYLHHSFLIIRSLVRCAM